MSTVEETGRTVEEAVESALRTLGVTRDQVEVEVLQEPKPALLGFGGRDARVRVSKRASPAETAQAFAAMVLDRMGYVVSVRTSDTPDSLRLDLEGQDVAGLIGRRGQTLDALGLLVGLHLQRRYGVRIPVVADAAGYRARHEKALAETAQRAAERAILEGQAIALEPMDPRDRRIVHLALRDHPEVTTASEGDEEDRHVVIFPGGVDLPAGQSPARHDNDRSSED